MSDQTKIGPEDVRHMAVLSRLRVKEEEERLFAAQFDNILGYMDILQNVDVEGVEPLYSPVTHQCVPREDVAQNKRTREEMLQNAPDSDESYFIVPRIV